MSTKQNAPFVIDMKTGDYSWCSCGESEKQPLYDGSHSRKNTGMKPLKIHLENDQKVAWCGCKESANKPFCDGSHTKIKKNN